MSDIDGNMTGTALVAGFERATGWPGLEGDSPKPRGFKAVELQLNLQFFDLAI